MQGSAGERDYAFQGRATESRRRRMSNEIPRETCTWRADAGRCGRWRQRSGERRRFRRHRHRHSGTGLLRSGLFLRSVLRLLRPVCCGAYYTGPVFIGGGWYNGPLRWRYWGGHRQFWYHGGWRVGTGWHSGGFHGAVSGRSRIPAGTVAVSAARRCIPDSTVAASAVRPCIPDSMADPAVRPRTPDSMAAACIAEAADIATNTSAYALR